MTSRSWVRKYLIWYYVTELMDDESYKDVISIEDRHRRDRRIPRCALRSYFYCSFRTLYLSGNDQALLNLTGNDHSTFSKLLSRFKPLYDLNTIDKDTGLIRPKMLQPDGKPFGKKRDMTAVGCMGLVLAWYRTRGSCARSLAMHFGQTSTPMYRWLDFGRKVLLACLINDPDARIEHPTEAQIRFFQSVIAEKYPHVAEAWAAADGLKLEFEKAGSHATQNKFYNGWTHGHYVNSVFVYSPDGKIRMCLINAPGTFHDSNMADYGIYEGMERVYLATGGKVVVDSAFKIGEKEFLIKSKQQDPLNPAELLKKQRCNVSEAIE